MLKNTKTRTLVREILDKSNSPLTPAEIFEKLKTLDVTLSSIYRTLEAFTKAADGKATKIIIPSEIQGLAGLAAGLKGIVENDTEKTAQ